MQAIQQLLFGSLWSVCGVLTVLHLTQAAPLQVQELQRRKIPSPMTEAERKINRNILQEIAKLTVGQETGYTIPAGH